MTRGSRRTTPDLPATLRRQLAECDEEIGGAEAGRLKLLKGKADQTAIWLANLRRRRQELAALLAEFDDLVMIPYIDLDRATKADIDRFFSD